MSRRAYERHAGVVNMSAEQPVRVKKYGAHRALTEQIHAQTSLPKKGIEQFLNNGETELLTGDETAIVAEWRDRFSPQAASGNALKTDALTL